MNHLISNNPHQVPPSQTTKSPFSKGDLGGLYMPSSFEEGFRVIVNINIVLAHKHNEEVAQLDNRSGITRADFRHTKTESPQHTERM